MKQIISRLKNISMMLIWDVITAIALFVFAYFSLDRMPSTMYKVLVLCGVALFVIIMLVIKYQLLYKKYGRDDVTGGKNKKEFERIARDLLRGDGNYVVVYANIDRFKLMKLMAMMSETGFCAEFTRLLMMSSAGMKCPVELWQITLGF